MSLGPAVNGAVLSGNAVGGKAVNERLAELSAAGALALKAGVDLNMGGVTTQLGSLDLHANNNINVVGARLTAENSLIATAGRDINLTKTTSQSGVNLYSVAKQSIEIGR